MLVDDRPLTASPLCSTRNWSTNWWTRHLPNKMKDSPVAQGTVKWFNSQKGFGFIQPDGGGNDVFVHISAVERAGLSQLGEGQKISFETETGRNGKASAVNLKVL
jgi:CspA family cold shock protein